MADDTKFKCNSNQYDVGLAVAKNISDSMVSYKDSITSAFRCLESVAETHKIDLTSTIDFSNINGDFVLADDYINDIFHFYYDKRNNIHLLLYFNVYI